LNQRAKKIFIISLLTLGLVVVATTRLFFGGGEDNWICVGGEWARHGNPNGGPPDEGCGD